MINKIFKQLVVTFVLTFFVGALPAHAGGLDSAFGNGSPLETIGGGAGYDTSQDVGSLVGTIINAALSMIGLIFLILMVYAGFLWMTARGNEDQVTKARGIMTGSVIGLVIVLSAYAITVFITGRLS